MATARKTDPQTSFEAADRVTNTTLTQDVILRLLKKPMTDDELWVEYQVQVRLGKAPLASPSGVRSRRHELVERGLVRSVGFAKSWSNRRMFVWGLK